MANFWDDGGTTGWAESAVENAAPVNAAPTNDQILEAWNENKNDPAKVQELMRTNNVGVRQASGILGVSQRDMANYLNSGRQAQSVRSGGGEGMDVRDVYNYDEVTPEAQTRDEFMATVQPGMLDAQGRFRGPDGGVNYRWEGMTPEQVFDMRQQQIAGQTPEALAAQSASGFDRQPVVLQGLNDPINLAWEPGPDTGGGVLGSIARGVGNLATGITKTPPLMMALTAGVGQMLTPAASAGATAGGVGTGGSAGIGSGTVLGGGSASVSPGILQTFAASPYARPAMSAVRTLASGGNLGDAVLSAGGSYLGGEASSALGGGAVGQVGGSVVSAAVSGRNPLQALVSAGVTAAAGEITGGIPGFEELSPSERSAITSFVASAMKGKNPTQALINSVTRLASNQVSNAGSRAPASDTQTGGWAA